MSKCNIAINGQLTTFEWADCDISYFCGGMLLANLNTYPPHPIHVVKEYPSLLNWIVEHYTTGLSVFVNDIVEGMWHTHLFSKLPKEPMRVGDRVYSFTLTEPTRNPNSGNMCQSLIITCVLDTYPSNDDDEYYDDGYYDDGYYDDGDD